MPRLTKDHMPPIMVVGGMLIVWVCWALGTDDSMAITYEFLFSWYGFGLMFYLFFTWFAWFGPEIPGTEREPGDELEYWEKNALAAKDCACCKVGPNAPGARPLYKLVPDHLNDSYKEEPQKIQCSNAHQTSRNIPRGYKIVPDGFGPDDDDTTNQPTKSSTAKKNE